LSPAPGWATRQLTAAQLQACHDTALRLGLHETELLRFSRLALELAEREGGLEQAMAALRLSDKTPQRARAEEELVVTDLGDDLLLHLPHGLLDVRSLMSQLLRQPGEEPQTSSARGRSPSPTRGRKSTGRGKSSQR